MDSSDSPSLASSTDAPSSEIAASTDHAVATENAASAENSVELLEASQPYVGRWDRLVSSTNWEKGRIIAEWRQALMAAQARPTEFSDETWSTLVGGVTPQHVGRLRRTYVRFHGQQETYAGLFWSHFLAALEWNDAELWLEGAVQNRWSVSQMRSARWEALGGAVAEAPQAADIVAAETDEDVPATLVGGEGETAEIRDPGDLGQEGPRYEEADFGDEGPGNEGDGDSTEGAEGAESAPFDFPTPQRPFENLAALPSDLQEAFESFKLAILHHKLNEWRDVSTTDVVAALRALEQLAMAPS
jgi:hypothetical protein